MKAYLKSDRKVIVDVIPLLTIDGKTVMYQDSKDGSLIYDHVALDFVEYYGG